MTSLSLCMIMRDEERLIPEFLDHSRGLYDQFVVVDTGSVDRTVPLLTAAGAEVHRQPWRDDFARARNESLRHATADWILVLDADEFPQEGFAEEIRALIASPGVGAATILRHDEQKNGIVRKARPLRLFRNDPGVAYRCRIHEDASESIAAMLAKRGERIAALETPVRHVGYLPQHMTGQNKERRDERLLKLALKDDPKDLYSRYKLLELYRFWGKAAKTAPIARECRRLIEAGQRIVPAHIAGDLVEMIRAALFAKDAEGGLAFLESMAPVADQTGHYHLACGLLLENKACFAEAGDRFRRAMAVATLDPARALIETRALAGLTRLAMAQGDMAGAKAHALDAARISPDDAEIALALGFLESLRL
ncbi:tetratricopeptide repeat-containing glycosyltransferase family 2 protein [Rhodospirillum rubrum]|nr:glycosyltransferase family 2 protein [Rhodospirillum rubrum]AEO48031.1 glycosyl transferase family protein [Rhodospirillum rubrum F11]QXG81954.1 glycosyltransferase family 2 protein [Rhodospirillum rubrum]